MKDNVFIDTNIWIYGLSESKLKSDIVKREISLTLFEGLITNKTNIYISIQVLNECHWNFVKKFNIKDPIVVELLRKNVIEISKVASIGLITYNLSNHIRTKYNLSFWDSLIVASALENNCTALYTEDMQDGQVIEGKLKIVNPFSDIK